jgi:hypothetical protein
VTQWILIGCDMSLWSLNTKKIKTTKLIFFYTTVTCTRGFSAYYSKLHVSYFYTDQQKIYFTNNNIFKMIPPGVQERRKQQPLYICITILYTIWNSKETRVLLYKVDKKRYTLHPQLPVENQRLICWTRIWLTCNTCNKCDWTRQMEFLNIYTGFWFI